MIRPFNLKPPIADMIPNPAVMRTSVPQTHPPYRGAKRWRYGMVITDATAGTKLARKVRKMAVVNYVPSRFGGYRNIPIVRIIEDPHGKNSAETLPIQMCDVAAYFLYQRFKPNAYVRKQKADRYFDRLSPVLNKHASAANSMGIVTL